MESKDENIVKFEIDLSNPPPLTAEQLATLEALERMPDSEIDYSDIPEMKFLFSSRRIVTLRLDSDVLAWVRSKGRNYQATINTILRKEMFSSQKK